MRRQGTFSPSTPRASAPPGDAGVTQTLEAIIVATIMVSSVAFVATFQEAPVATQGQRGIVQTAAQDALNILADEPSAGAGSPSLLNVALLQCLQSNCTLLQQKLGKLLPQGARYGVYLSNGQGTFPVYEPVPPPGEAVSVDHLFEPAWSSSFVAPTLSLLNPSQDAMQVVDIPIFNGNVLAGQGHLLDVVVKGVRTGDNATYVLRTSVATRAVTNATAASTPAASLEFVDGSGNPLASLDARAQTISAPGVPTKTPVPLTLRVNESAGVPLPAGTNVTLLVPRGWNASAAPALNPGWAILANATDTSGSAGGSTLVASLLAPLAKGVADLKLNATYDGDLDDHYVFHAALSRGAFASASLLVTGDAQATLPPFEAPGVYVSAPNPMGATATTTWTLAANVAQSGLPGFSESVLVNEVDITEESGARVFGSVQGLSSAGGAWTSHGTTLVWTGNATVSHFAPLNLTFLLSGLGSAVAPAASAPFWPSVSLDGWSGRVGDVGSPGVYRAQLLPSGAYHGYNASLGGWLEANHSATSASIYRATALPGSFGYTVGAVTAVRDALYGSDLAVASRKVPLGGTASVAINVQSLVYQLGELGVKPVVTLNLYPPWSGDARVPLWSQTLYNAPLALGNATLMSILDLNGDGIPDPTYVGQYNATIPIPANWLFGPYVLDASVTWNDTLSATINGQLLSVPIARSAHVYDYIQVASPSLLSNATPVYDARLVVWFPDW